jgi:hypothetical protein
MPRIADDYDLTDWQAPVPRIRLSEAQTRIADLAAQVRWLRGTEDLPKGAEEKLIEAHVALVGARAIIKAEFEAVRPPIAQVDGLTTVP